KYNEGGQSDYPVGNLNARDRGFLIKPFHDIPPQKLDAITASGLPRARRERPRRRAAEQRDEVAPLHVEHEASPPGKPAPIPLSKLTASSACRRAVGESLGQT